jgi:BatD DUF11 like domain
MRIVDCARLRGWGLGLLLACTVAPAIAVHPATFSATLDRNAIAVGESATLSLTFEGGKPSGIPNLQVPNLNIQSLGQSSQFTVVNGQMSSSVSYNYQVTASRPGDYVIPAIQVEVDHQTLTSQPLALRVSKGSGATGLAFLKLVPSKETVYVGEVFPIEIQLYLGTRQDSLQMPQIEGDGFIFGKMAQPTQGNTQVGNQMYTVGTFRVSAVAVKTGTLALGPAQCSLVLYIPINTRGRSVFDDFFGGGAQRKPVTLSSEPQTITVLPLPKENQPPSFNGAVGNFSVTASASPTNLTAGDPITLRLQIAGKGNLESLPFPGGTDWSEFKLYPPTSKTETSDALGISGVKTFERVVIPQSPELKELPAITLSFFDPEQKAYRTLQTPPLPVNVRPSSAAQPQPTVLANSKQAEEAPPTRDIVHIKPYLGAIVGLEAPLVMRPWFLALQGVPMVAWLSALIWRKRREALENNPRLRRRRLVAETVRKGSKELPRLAEAQEGEAFFGTVFRLLQEQLGERLDMPASAITEAVLDERVRGRAPDELIRELHDLFQFCNQARYAPHRSTQEFMALVPKTEAALRGLQELPDLSKR